MRRHAFRSLGEVLRGLDLPRHAAGAGALAAIQQQWARCLPPVLARHSRPLWYRDGCLLVEVDGPAWATRLRHLQQSLCQSLQASGACPGLSRLRIRVRPPS